MCLFCCFLTSYAANNKYVPLKRNGVENLNIIRCELKRHIVDGENKLYQYDFQIESKRIKGDKGNMAFVLKYDFVLAENIVIPDNCVLLFEGGSISAGNDANMNTITGDNTGIDGGLVKIFDSNIVLAGTWNIKEAYPEWFGAKGDNIQDDTTPITKAIHSFGKIKLQSQKTYRVTKSVNIPSNRIIDLNHSTIYWDGIGADNQLGAIFKCNLVQTGIKCSVNRAIIRGDDFIVVSSPSRFNKNDVVYVDTPIKQNGGETPAELLTKKPYIFLNKVAKIVEIKNDTLCLDATFSFDCPIDKGINVCKIVPNEKIAIKNGHFTSKNQLSRNDGIGGILFGGVINCTIENCSFEKLWFHAITIYMSSGVTIDGVIVKNPPFGAGWVDGGGGDAYGIQFCYSNNCKANNLKGYSIRHLVDCTCATNILISNAEDYKSINASYNHHSCYEDGITYMNCKSYDAKYHGFAMGTDPSKDFARTSYNNTLVRCEVHGSGNYALVYHNEGYGLRAYGCKFATKGNFSTCFANNDCHFDKCEFNNGFIVTKADYINDEHKSIVRNSILTSVREYGCYAVEVVANQSIEIINSYIEGRLFLLDGSRINLDSVNFKGLSMSKTELPIKYDYIGTIKSPHTPVTNSQEIIIKNSYLDWSDVSFPFVFLGRKFEMSNSVFKTSEDSDIPIDFKSIYTELKNNKMNGRILNTGASVNKF